MKVRKGKRGWFMLKLDLKKAYEKLEWGFIRNAFTLYGLDPHSVDMIMSCVSSITSSVLVNAIPTKSFFPSRGIRQGGPLSPPIFLSYVWKSYQYLYMMQLTKGCGFRLL